MHTFFKLGFTSYANGSIEKKMIILAFVEIVSVYTSDEFQVKKVRMVQIECGGIARLVSNSMSFGMQRRRAEGGRGGRRGGEGGGAGVRCIARCCRKWPPHLSARLTAGDIRHGNGPRPSWNRLPVAFLRRPSSRATAPPHHRATAPPRPDTIPHC